MRLEQFYEFFVSGVGEVDFEPGLVFETDG